MQKPFFSIIIPAYNLENYIAAALQSVLVQTFQNFEIIIVMTVLPMKPFPSFNLFMTPEFAWFPKLTAACLGRETQG